MTWLGARSARGLEPVGGDLVEHLALERDRAEHDVEGADAIGDHDDPAPVARVAVAHLALVLVAQVGEVGLVEGLFELCLDDVVGNHARFSSGSAFAKRAIDDLARPAEYRKKKAPLRRPTRPRRLCPPAAHRRCGCRGCAGTTAARAGLMQTR